MHKIKSAAKRQAWSNDDGTTNFNPFGKLWVDSHYRQGDEEDGLARTVSDGNLMGKSTADENRKSQLEGHSMPHHADTMPNMSSRPATRAGPLSAENAIAEERKDKIEDSNTSGTSNTLVSNEGPMEENTGVPRKRKTMGGILGKFSHHSPPNPGPDEVKHTKSNKPVKKYTFMSQIQHTLLNSWINVLLILAPVGIVLFAIKADPKAIFVVNFIAIIPLAAMLSYATEEIALRTGETIGGLLNATFGNAVELIVSVIALFDNQIDIVQTSLIGSMLSNLLLVMGMCFFFGGLKRVEQHFNVTVAQTAASLLALAIGSLIVPTVYNQHVGAADYDPDPTDSTPALKDDATKQSYLAQMSHGTSILLLLVYGCYLYFQLSTHAAMYNEPSKKAVRRKPKVEKGDAIRGMARAGQVGASSSNRQDVDETMIAREDEEEEAEVPNLSLTAALVTLAISTAFVAVCAEFMVESIDAITEGGGISREFVGLILLPIVGNAAEHATAVTVAVKDKMDLAIGVAVGSSMQIALLVLPLVVLIGWIAGIEEMNLAFDGFQVIVLFVSVLLVNYLIGDGKSHWLEGVLLNVLYLIIAIAAWYYPSPIVKE